MDPVTKKCYTGKPERQPFTSRDFVLDFVCVCVWYHSLLSVLLAGFVSLCSCKANLVMRNPVPVWMQVTRGSSWHISR